MFNLVPTNKQTIIPKLFCANWKIYHLTTPGLSDSSAPPWPMPEKGSQAGDWEVWSRTSQMGCQYPTVVLSTGVLMSLSRGLRWPVRQSGNSLGILTATSSPVPITSSAPRSPPCSSPASPETSAPAHSLCRTLHPPPPACAWQDRDTNSDEETQW